MGKVNQKKDTPTPVLMLELLVKISRRRMGANELANYFGVTKRSIYRYIDMLSIDFPITIFSGRYGGYELVACNREIKELEDLWDLHRAFKMNK